MIWILILVSIYVGLLTLFWFAQDGLVYPRKFAGQPIASRPPSGAEQVWIDAEGARVEGWYFPPADSSQPRPVVLYAHGNAMLIDDCQQFAQMYLQMGLGVMLVEFRGYGISGGQPSQHAIVRDFAVFRDWLDARPEVGQIVYHGRSLGGSVVAQLAREQEPDAMILESTFTSVSSFTNRYLIPPLLLRSPFNTAKALREISAPILIMHGESDEIVPIAQGRRLHELAADSQFESMEGGHNDFPRDFDGYERSIRLFLAEQGVVQP